MTPRGFNCSIAFVPGQARQGVKMGAGLSTTPGSSSPPVRMLPSARQKKELPNNEKSHPDWYPDGFYC
jgi:hypothetical protein